jgi:hypothetical protein
MVTLFLFVDVSKDLRNLSDVYAKGEEERLRENLESVGWDVDSPNTVALITGPGRIERVRAGFPQLDSFEL